MRQRRMGRAGDECVTRGLGLLTSQFKLPTACVSRPVASFLIEIEQNLGSVLITSFFITNGQFLK